MASLKDLKNRIKSVKSTQKITKAMKVVAAAKLRKAQDRAEAARPYSEKLLGVMSSLAAGAEGLSETKNLLTGSGSFDNHLVIVATSSRGLCGGFNASIAKAALKHINELLLSGKQVKILCVGSKGNDYLKRFHADKIVENITGIQQKTVEYASANLVREKVTAMFEAGEIDVCSMFYNKFITAMTQEVTRKQLLPLELEIAISGDMNSVDAPYDFEPDQAQILSHLLPKNMAIQIYSSLLENQASEMGARMTAMDNATRNAGDMIDRLTLVYNRTRQAAITTELIEIIAGAEAI
jgi:F-type H+-transporting ATPase subunit gamma